MAKPKLNKLTFSGFWLALILFVPVTFRAQNDTLTVFENLAQGKISGYWRNYYMATDNEGNLTDWNALATGGLLKYQAKVYQNISLDIGFYFNSALAGNYQMFDTTTLKRSRYESGLFDLEDLSKREFALLGELFLQYSYKKHTIKIGRYKMKSPLINPEDGRMIPTLEQGVWYRFKTNKKWTFQLFGISRISPRGTSRFMPVQESFGIYPVGKTIYGTNAQYKRNTSSYGIAVLNINYSRNKFNHKIWNYYVENVFNTLFYEGNFSFNKKEKIKHSVAWQFIYQNKINNGGNPDTLKRYFNQNNSKIAGLQYKVSINKTTFSVNGNYIFNDGRFLFPREWGREFLFVFQKRERLEGVSNTLAWMVQAKHKFVLAKKRILTAALGYGQYYRPDAKTFRSNKYAMPANDQLNLDLIYMAHPNKKGMNIELLITRKNALGNTYNNPNFILNKVNMTVFNLIMNYRF